MKKISIPFAATHQFSPLISDYLSGAPALKSFYSLPPEPESFADTITRRQGFACDRQLLTERLLFQYTGIFNNERIDSTKVLSALKLLKNDNCFTVTTGHQLNIFTGPLYCIYKIVTTIRLAEELKARYNEFDFVPVFWMASEDHDFEEINNTRIFGKPVVWNREPGGATGRLSTDGMKQVLDQVKEILGSSTDCLGLFENAYLSSATLAEATRKIIHGLFGSYGLVVIDADDALLKKSFIREMKDDLFLNKSFKAVTATSAQMSENYKPQVQPREINLFYLAEGSRNRIVKNESGSFEILSSGITFTEEEIVQKLESHPENFSPNVVLRPMYQEKILPGVAYVGGPGELSYWLQYKDAFAANNIFFPILMLRNCFQLIDKGSAGKLEKLGIPTADLFENNDSLIKMALENASGINIGTEGISELLQTSYNELASQWTKLDPSLVPGIEAEKQKMMKGIISLEEKARRALKKKNELIVNQIINIKEKLQPEGQGQERSENFIPYYCRLKDEFIKEIMKQSDPFTKQFAILVED